MMSRAVLTVSAALSFSVGCGLILGADFGDKTVRGGDGATGDDSSGGSDALGASGPVVDMCGTSLLGTPGGPCAVGTTGTKADQACCSWVIYDGSAAVGVAGPQCIRKDQIPTVVRECLQCDDAKDCPLDKPSCLLYPVLVDNGTGGYRTILRGMCGVPSGVDPDIACKTASECDAEPCDPWTCNGQTIRVCGPPPICRSM